LVLERRRSVKLALVGVIYLAGAVFGLGVLLLQLFWSGGDDPGGHHGAITGHVDGDGLADQHDHLQFLPLLLSLHFWSFALLAFGLSGSLLHYLELASAWWTLGIAVLLGLFSGAVATAALSWLKRSETSTGADLQSAVGSLAKVLVPCRAGEQGKVRVELAGSTIDLAATADEVLEFGSTALIIEVRGTTAYVSRAPRSLYPEAT
jgi:membrane protein implicated in regulation of membrane protease activity